MQMRMNSDHDAVARIRARVPGAFEHVYRVTRDGVFGLLVALAGSRDVAEELLQETYARFLARVYRADDAPRVDDVRAYLLRIARNLVIDAQRESPSPATLDAVDEPALADEPADDDGPERALRLLRRLPTEQREVIVLRLYNDLSYPSIAEMTDTPVKTLESRYRYGIAKLKRWWDERP